MSLHHICQTCYEMLYVRARDSPTRGLASPLGRQNRTSGFEIVRGLPPLLGETVRVDG